MKVKTFSIMLGYREFDARVRTDVNPAMLELDGYGPLPPLDFIKHGVKILEAKEAELRILKQAGYNIRLI